MHYRLTLFTFIIAFLSTNAQEVPDKGLEAISIRAVEAPLGFLASDWTEGREVGTKGAYMAADYIASIFQMYGIKPLGDKAVKRINRERRMSGEQPEIYRSYFQNFDLLSADRIPENEIFLLKKTGPSVTAQKLTEGLEYQMGGVFGTFQTEAPLLFAGYGIQNKKLKSDPYKNTDVKGKIVFLLAGFAGKNDPDSENFKTLESDTSFSFRDFEREKIELARKLGAVAVVRFSPGKERRLSQPSNLPMFYDHEFYEGDQKMDDYYHKRIRLPYREGEEEMPFIEINEHIAISLLEGSGNILETMQKSDFDMSSFQAKELEGVSLRLSVDNDPKVIRARNILGYIEGENPEKAMVIGAHYDHVGKYNGFIFNGADDNASGTVGMLTLARALRESGKKPSMTIIFAGWTGEEQGLWGSKYFVKNIPDSLKIVLNVNMDMISRTSLKDSSASYLSFQYTKGHESFEEIFRTINAAYNLDLDIRYKADKQPRGGSDFAPFAEEGIPIISLFTGLHRDYHMPNDEMEFVDLPKMVNIIKLTYLGINDILKN